MVTDMFSFKPLPPYQPETKDSVLTKNILRTLNFAGIHGEDAQIELQNILYDIKRSDLLPPCCRAGQDVSCESCDEFKKN